MKTAIVIFKDPSQVLDGQYLNEITNVMLFGGYPVDTLEILSIYDDLGFRRSLNRLKDVADNLVIINNPSVTFSIKEIIAEQTETTLVEKDSALKFLEAVEKAHGKKYPQEYAVMPMESTLIPNLNGAFQGFMLDDNAFALVCVPDAIADYKIACQQYLFPYLNNKNGVNTTRLVLKYFGSKEKLESAIEQAKNGMSADLDINVTCSYGDYTITVVCDQEDCKEIARRLVGQLKENIYAEFDTTLGERLFDLLKLKNLKLATAESFTGGRVVGAVISNVGASSYVHEGIVSYSNESKADRLDIKLEDIIKDGAVSSVTAYRMAAGLLKKGGIDIAVSTTGFAGPKTPESTDPVGLAYVGVGMLDGVHTYKLNLSGSREEITETAKNTALFLTIKKLKSIN